MPSLYEKLMYNWERGFYSVVEYDDSDYDGKSYRKRYVLFSTKDQFGRLAHSESEYEKDDLRFSVGQYYSTKDILSCYEEPRIVDTIHPSELMGKGFQVGDKVEVAGGIYTLKAIDGPRVVITNNTSVRDINTDYNHLKPVLPEEENEKIVKNACGHLGLLYLDKRVDGYICHKCGEEMDNAIKLLKEKGIIKDGHIVNL